MFFLIFGGLFLILLKLIPLLFFFLLYTVPIFIYNYIVYFCAIVVISNIFYLFYLLFWAITQLWDIFCYCIFHPIATVTPLTSLAWQCVLTVVHWYGDSFVQLYTFPLTALTQINVLGALLCTVIGLIVLYVLINGYIQQKQRDDWQRNQKYNRDQDKFNHSLPVEQVTSLIQAKQTRAQTVKKTNTAATSTQPVLFRTRETDLERRRRILAFFQCPYETEKKLCQLSKFCVFSHFKSETDQQANLENLPSYLCPLYLLNLCNSKNSSVCERGLHPASFVDLPDLAAFESRNKLQIDSYYGVDRKRQCNLCYETVLKKMPIKKRQFGILKSCTHVFCFECLQQWEIENSQHNRRPRAAGEICCPTCQKVSRQYISQKRFIDKSKEKRTLFAKDDQKGKKRSK